jgi:hypothetical protein
MTIAFVIVVGIKRFLDSIKVIGIGVLSMRIRQDILNVIK